MAWLPTQPWLNPSPLRREGDFLTDDDGDNVLLAAIEAGASAVLYMSTAASQVIDAIRVVADGGSLIPAHTIAKLLHNRL
ncbi:MAG: response regulator transcription factor, partial [Chloroflexi bacterium]